jgi:hypothetical protein
VIRKVVIVISLMLAAGTGALWLASYWATQPWLVERPENGWVVVDSYSGYLSISYSQLRLLSDSEVLALFETSGSHTDADLLAIANGGDLSDGKSLEETIRGGAGLPRGIAPIYRFVWHTGPRTHETPYKSLREWIEWNKMKIIFPLWAPLLVFGTYPTISFIRGPLRRRRRRRRGLCVHCGYNLTGLPEPRCPECGRTA